MPDRNSLLAGKFVRETRDACNKFLQESGFEATDPLVRAARQVVWARYTNAKDGWQQLKEAIGQLEDLVGRPTTNPSKVKFL